MTRLRDVGRAFADVGDDARDIARRLLELAPRDLESLLHVETDDEGVARIAEVRGAPEGTLGATVDLDRPDAEVCRLCGAQTRLWAQLPLVSGGAWFGVVLVAGTRPPSADSVLLAEVMADFAAIAMDRAHRTAHLRRSLDELRQSREALGRAERLRTIGQMAAMLAHEVRNPLAAVLGGLQLLGGGVARGGREDRLIHAMTERIGSLRQLVDELLVFARPHAPNRITVNTGMILRSVADTVLATPGWEELDIDIETDGADAYADPGQIQRVLLNLVQNAAQAMDGRGRVHLKATRTQSGCTIQVRDEGPGIPAELRARLFEPFFTTRESGTGLGLALSRQIAEAHGGSLDVECPDGRGAVFTLRLG